MIILSAGNPSFSMAYCITTSTAFFSDSGLGSPYNITVKKRNKYIVIIFISKTMQVRTASHYIYLGKKKDLKMGNK